MKGNKILYAGIAILVLGIGFAIGTYAYYQTTITGTATGTVLAWDCDAATGPASVQMPNLYPGDAGSFTITVTSEITSSYSIKFTGLTHIGTDSDRANLKLYQTKNGTSYSSEIVNNTTISGTVATNGGTSTKTIYWNWPYGTTGETYSSAAPTFTYTVTCTQM